ncbi:MAG: aminotransferase class V-fold PLP-dependent enzyme [Clostridia bacterium]|nr:aminotransferase class V-fold PLP-dependent enzyme [Clostridia bacterium]
MIDFGLSSDIKKLSEEALILCEKAFKEIDKIAEYNQQRALKSFIDCKVSESHLWGSTGYGYNDRGRETLDKLYAQLFDAEDALVRHSFVCGTHAIATALFGVLRPGDTMLCATGKPYDTLKDTIGIGKNTQQGSLKDFHINYRQVNLKSDGHLDLEEINHNITSDVKLVYLQRSRGYSLRASLYIEDIKKLVDIAKNKNPNCIVVVDNCYGEFTQKVEPSSVGADLVAGSLIKNPGGGIAPAGGYIAGRKNLVQMCSYRLTAPGIGKEVGATLNCNRELFLGIFNAPHATGEAMKTAVFAAALFELIGFEVYPKYSEPRADIIECIKLGDEKKLIKFCKTLQSFSPIDSFVSPEPWEMPGYSNKIIMAAGTFTQGASIELSADAPLREPYAVWLQGGLNFHSSKVAIMAAAQEVLKK